MTAFGQKRTFAKLRRRANRSRLGQTYVNCQVQHYVPQFLLRNFGNGAEAAVQEEVQIAFATLRG
jgi:hypothetical protein